MSLRMGLGRKRCTSLDDIVGQPVEDRTILIIHENVVLRLSESWEERYWARQRVFQILGAYTKNDPANIVTSNLDSFRGETGSLP